MIFPVSVFSGFECTYIKQEDLEKAESEVYLELQICTLEALITCSHFLHYWLQIPNCLVHWWDVPVTKSCSKDVIIVILGKVTVCFWGMELEIFSNQIICEILNYWELEEGL